MRKIIYLILIVVLALVTVEFLRKFNQANVFVPSVLNEKTEELDEDENSESIGEYLSAAVAQRSGDYDKAIEYYEKALVDNPENIDIPKRLYGLYLYEGEYDKTLELSKRNIELDKLNKVPMKELNPNPYLVVALDHFKKKEYAQASRLLAPLADPSIPDQSHIDGVVIPLILAWSYVVEGDYRSAFDVIDNITTNYMLSVFAYNRALINDIANGKPVLVDGKEMEVGQKAKDMISDVFYEIGQYSMQNYNLDEAVIYFRLARFLDPKVYKFNKMLAATFEAQEKFAKALEIYEEVEEGSKYYPEAQIGRALALHKLDRNDEATEILSKMTEEEKHAFKALIATGSILMSDGKYEEAIKYFNKASEKVDSYTREHWNIFFNLGVAHDRLGNWEKAEDNLKKSVQLFPENPESLNYLAYSWIIKEKNVKQARSMLESAVIRSGGAPHILDSYGWALYKLGNYEDALPFLEQAALAIPYNPVINAHLGDLYFALDRKREAVYQWNKAVYYYDEKEDATQEVDIDEIKKKIEKHK